MDEFNFQMEMQDLLAAGLNSSSQVLRKEAFTNVQAALYVKFEREAFKSLRLKNYRFDALEAAQDIVMTLFAKFYDLWVEQAKAPRTEGKVTWAYMERYMRASLRNAIMDTLRSKAYSRRVELDESVDATSDDNLEMSMIVESAIEKAAVEFTILAKHELEPRHLRAVKAVVEELESFSGDSEDMKMRMTIAKQRAADRLGLKSRSVDNNWSKAISLLKTFFDSKLEVASDDSKLKNDAAVELMMRMSSSPAFLA
jgi:hypothetical protein